MMIGIGLGEENGILIQNVKMIEIMQDVDIIVFDMTGNIIQCKLEETEFKKVNKELNDL